MVKLSDEDETIYSETLNQFKQFGLSKNDTELFKDEDYTPNTLISVKRIDLPKKGIEDWEINVDKEVVLVLKGNRFTNKEKEYLRSVDGMKFLVSSFKSGNRSVVKIKEHMKLFV